MGTTGRFKAWIVRRLAYWQCQQGPGKQRLLGTRMRVLLQNVLDLNWAKHCAEAGNDEKKEHTESRIDPSDGKPYTLPEVLHYYRRHYTEHEIRRYFAFDCKPVDAKPDTQILRPRQRYRPRTKVRKRNRR